MINKNQLLFRCDQNSKSGFGHFSRCLNLARHLISFKEWNIHFLGNYSEFAISLLLKFDIEYTLVEDTQFEQVYEEKLIAYDFVIFDSYFIKQDYIDAIGSLDFNSIVIDDTCTLDFTNINLVINFRYNAEKLFQYPSRKSALGIDYFIFKPEFLKIRNESEVHPKIKNLLLFFGGLEIDSSTVNFIIDTIKELNEDIDIHYISNDFSNLTAINKNRIIALKPTFEIEKVLTLVDGVINGGGLIKYESSFCKIPSASISTTALQYEDTLILERQKLIYNLGFLGEIEKEKLKSNLNRFITDIDLRRNMIEKSESFFNENSINNILKIMCNE